MVADEGTVWQSATDRQRAITTPSSAPCSRAFAQALGPDFHAREAWRLALTAVAAVMQEAAAGGE